MQILPDDTFLRFTDTLSSFITSNALVVVSVIALGVAIAFVVRWFNSGTRRISPSDDYWDRRDARADRNA